MQGCHEPLGIFWDIENCQVPKNKSANDICEKVRNYIVKPRGFREFEFFCGCDTTTLTKQVCEELNLAGVTIAHVPSSSKNAADEKIREQMIKFVDTHGSRATVMLISGDINFAPTLRGFRDRIGAKVLLMHSTSVAHQLKNCADEVTNFTQFCEDLQMRLPVSENGGFHIKVDGLPRKVTAETIRRELQMLTQNRGGKVTQVTQDSAIIEFPSQRDAERALNGINGIKINNSTVSAKIVTVPTNKQETFRLIVSGFSGKLPQKAVRAKLLSFLVKKPKSIFVADGSADLEFTNSDSMEEAYSRLDNLNFDGFPLTAQKVNKTRKKSDESRPQVQNTNDYSFRLIVSGFSGKLPEKTVRTQLLSLLTNKPKSISIVNGTANLEFTNNCSMEEAYSRLNGISLDELPLILSKVFKPRTKCDEIRNQTQNNKDSFRLIVCGFSGKLPKSLVTRYFMSSLVKKPKSIIIGDGSADLEFTNYGSAEEAYSCLHGIHFDGFPLIARRAYKCGTNSDGHPNLAQKAYDQSCRLVVSGISGTLPSQYVEAILLCMLSKKPKSILIGDGNANLEFTNHSAMEEAFARFDGFDFHGYPLKAQKVYKSKKN